MSAPDLLVYAAATMNGWKPLIFLEEAGVPYELRAIDLGAREQKQDWYVALNPNGRIPTLVDRGRDDFVVFESGAILWYLAERVGRFLPDDLRARSEVLQWVMFQMSGVGPMMGQAMYFQRIAAPKGQHDPFAIERYVKESRRLLEVLDRRLDGRDYLVDDYSIADMAMYPWARSYPWARVSVRGLPHLRRWFDRLDARPAIQRAVSLPVAFPAFFGQGDEDTAVQANADRFDLQG